MAKKMKYFLAPSKFGPEICPVIYVSHGSILFLPGLNKRVKSAVKQRFSGVEQRVVYSTNKLLFATNKDIFTASKNRKATRFINSHATATVGVYTVPPKDCTTKLSNTFLYLSALDLPRNAYFLPVSANFPPSLIPSLLLRIQTLDFIFNKILPVLYITMTVQSLFLHKTARSPFHLSAFEATFIKTSNPPLYRP